MSCKLVSPRWLTIFAAVIAVVIAVLNIKLSGDADKPTLQINPLSVIAPGIFRSIFEFR